MEPGKLLRKTRCKYCNITFPLVRATENMTEIPFHCRMLICKRPDDVINQKITKGDTTVQFRKEGVWMTVGCMLNEVPNGIEEEIEQQVNRPYTWVTAYGCFGCAKQVLGHRRSRRQYKAMGFNGICW